jgi:undecaprenyl-diphosphatase
MIETLERIDSELFLFLNSFHNSFFDVVMWNVSKVALWIPLYLWFLWLLYKAYPKNYLLLVLTVAIMIFTTDQIANLAKNSFVRYRPSHNPAFSGIIHLVKGYTGGSYGFFSGHATNSFAVATFVSLTLGSKNPNILWIAFFYAFIVSYSRIYLGVHYPGDVLTGAFTGALAGFLMYKLFSSLSTVMENRKKGK